MKHIALFTTLIAAILIAVPLHAQDQRPADEELEETLERLPEQIEAMVTEMMKDLADSMERGMDRDDAERDEPTGETLQLTFELNDVSGPVTVLVAGHEWAVDVESDTRQAGDEGRTQLYRIDMAGAVVPLGDDENAYRVTFDGGFELHAVDYEGGKETRKQGRMNTRGSVEIKIGQTKTIAQNGDATLTLTITRLEDPTPV